MIRITNNMLVNDLKRNLNSNMRNMDIYQRQLSTGRKINQPSDNPAGLVKSLRLRTSLTEGEQYIANIDEALNFMETTDAALDNVNQILQRVRELTVKAGNGTNDASAFEAIAAEIGELVDQLKLVANTTYGAKYIFAGSNVTEPPVDGDKWQGNEQLLELEIGAGVKIDINLTMKGFFGNPDGLDDAGVSDGGLFGLLNDLETAVNSGDLEAVKTGLGDIDGKIDSLLSMRAVVGAKINRLELQKNRLESTQTSFTGLLAQNEDADMAEVIMQLKMQENVYRASLAAGTRIILPSLADFLR
ncbi:MAG: flagellar hook-associated protein FlgL [Syntrophomonadaceae bacterium]|nr:flagellar hook-associated protein FlgL [Syntrophomonadaceae bacterium]